ncbi:hypothetical protein T484DRAFT_2829492 [Baffinella frigidus]|nr:hypothetical protein T484DRAFT_2829492 [Cryptophyta sp. CCMP2293]
MVYLWDSWARKDGLLKRLTHPHNVTVPAGKLAEVGLGRKAHQAGPREQMLRNNPPRILRLTLAMQFVESRAGDGRCSEADPIEDARDSWGSQETETNSGSPTRGFRHRVSPTSENSTGSPTSRNQRGSEREFPSLRAFSDGPENIEEIVGDLSQVDFNKGDVILKEGSCDRALFVVVQGFALAQAADGHVLTRCGPGEVFGEISMYATGNRGASCSVVAGSATTGVKIFHLPQGFSRCPSEGYSVQMARLHRFVARTLAVRAQSQVRRDTVFEY